MRFRKKTFLASCTFCCEAHYGMIQNTKETKHNNKYGSRFCCGQIILFLC